MPLLVPLIIVSVLLALVVAACVWLWVDRRHLRDQRTQLTNDLSQAERQAGSYREEIAALQREITSAQSDAARLEEKVAAFDRRIEEREADFRQRLADERQHHQAAQQKAREAFEAVANQVLDKSNERFLKLANQTFEGQQKDAAAQLEQRKQAIEAIVKPIREQLDKYAASVTDIEKSRREAYGSLRQQLASMVETQQGLRGETANLVKALRRPEVRGRWGEMQLRRAAELAGMIPHCDFDEQVTVRTVEGVQKPDMVIHLPGGRDIVVDAKTPISAYIEAAECEDDDARQQCLDRFVRHVEDKVRDLAAKDYQRQFDRSPDFLVLFIPGESFLFAALQRKPDLLERAMRVNVMIASPMTLIALLRAVAAGWREQRIAESAEQLRDLGQQLHERIAVAYRHAETLGTHLGNAVNSYNQYLRSIESRVLVSARRFKELGADSPKELPAEGEVKQVDTPPRPVEQLTD